MLAARARLKRRGTTTSATSEQRVRRLDRAISQACGGTREIRLSHDDTLVRVYWRSDAAGATV